MSSGAETSLHRRKAGGGGYLEGGAETTLRYTHGKMGETSVMGTMGKTEMIGGVGMMSLVTFPFPSLPQLP
jgi:hypothetical protein